MVRCGSVFSLVAVLAVCRAGEFMVDPGPKYPPTKGEVWPKPQHEEKENALYKFDKAQFSFKIMGETCVLLLAAVVRYENLLHEQLDAARAIRRELLRRNLRRRSRSFVTGLLGDMHIELTKPCDAYPHLGMDERYNLTVGAETYLKSDSIWGVLRGLETFAQLFYPSENYNGLLVNATEIYDYPRYSHRGLMLDTSRHYISVANIKTNLDAMAMNKMNVFHWHIVDDQSFPFQSEKFPELSEKGAYHPTMIYTRTDIKEIVEYARDRGIRVIPEIDVPGHTRSWGNAYPQLLAACYKDNMVVGLGPMNPISNFTYKMLEEFIHEVQDWFPDEYYHLGGDEVDLECWSSNPYLLDYMLHYNVSSVAEFQTMFMERVLPMLSSNSQAIVWQEVFDEYVPLPEDSLVQIWKEGWQKEINTVLSSGLGVIFSTEWYLSDVHLGGDWEKFYAFDPRADVTDRSLLHKVVGGEACMWGEYIDDRNFISRVWPRASGIAERLWSYASLDGARDQSQDSMERMRHRMEEQACRMVRRDVPAQPPNGPGVCVA